MYSGDIITSSHIPPTSDTAYCIPSNARGDEEGVVKEIQTYVLPGKDFQDRLSSFPNCEQTTTSCSFPLSWNLFQYMNRRCNSSNTIILPVAVRCPQPVPPCVEPFLLHTTTLQEKCLERFCCLLTVWSTATIRPGEWLTTWYDGGVVPPSQSLFVPEIEEELKCLCGVAQCCRGNFDLCKCGQETATIQGIAIQVNIIEVKVFICFFFPLNT
mgnify:CR=1 FL=1